MLVFFRTIILQIVLHANCLSLENLTKSILIFPQVCAFCSNFLVKIINFSFDDPEYFFT